ncbi:MAG: 3'-5' exonuclease [Clostridium sp.]|nr:3'-5' exonuclease [Prevotella sp.]MCM1428225.1 3'-5' exonuclease [Clostridium sp.]MCM1475955.1 3'-5' exonuclease [Muribaculaceae bacterium]
MGRSLSLKRPLIFFDLETTGIDISKDRIVEISIIKVFPDGQENLCKTRRINPEMHIPAEASAVHKIFDEDVKDCPTFREISKSLLELFENSDIAGYNSNKFDLPLLIEEFARAGLPFQLSGRNLVDVQNIFYKKEPRTLSGALKFYCGKDLENAHTSMADTQATLDVLIGQLDKYPDLDTDVESLANFSRINKNVDLAGRIILNDYGEPVFNFGKHKGSKVFDVFRKEPSFYNWMLQGTFAKNTKDELMKLHFQYLNQNA